MPKYIRNGDHYLHEIKELPKNLKKIKHNGKFVFGTGEKANHNHTMFAKNPDAFDVYQEEKTELFFFVVKDEANVGHFVGDSEKTAEHKTTVIEKPLKFKVYRQVIERELDLFSGVKKQVVD